MMATEAGGTLRFQLYDKVQLSEGAGGGRGRCRGFTDGSRRRFLRRIGRLDYDMMMDRNQGYRPVLCTLTYGQRWPTPQVAKAHLDVFIKRIMRRLDGKGAVFWRMESQSWGAPHFHLVIFGAYLGYRTFRFHYEELQEWWAEIVGEEHWDHSQESGPEYPFTDV